MRPALLRVIPGLFLLAILASPPARAMDATVPSVPYPDVQAAVAALSVSPDLTNNIFIAAPSITTSNSIVLSNAFGLSRRLVIRPASTLARAQILSNGLNAPILSLQGSGYVQIQDLDIVRTITNTADLIQTVNTTLTTIERCRIGSSAPPAPAGLSYIRIVYPGDGGITIRNCIFFSTYKLAFDYGINVVAMGDPSNELFLYNNCVADYNRIGVQVNDAIAGSLVLLRNNLVVNNLISAPEPVAYNSGVVPGAIVVTSDNLAFASPVKVQTGVPPNQDIYGTAATQVGIDLPPTPAEESSSFVTMAWDPTAGALNTDFYRTEATGPLHDTSASWGVTVGSGTPDPHDEAVTDDIEKLFRPGGSPSHTDRGPFQTDPGAGAGANPQPETIDWANVPGTNNVRFHVRWIDPDPNQPTAPGLGSIKSQQFGVFLPDAGTIGNFSLPSIAVQSFFDVFVDVSRDSLPPSATKQLVGGGPGSGGNCPPDDHWDGNVDVTWNTPSGTGQVNKHVGQVLLNTGGGNSFIHVISGCTLATGTSWSLGAICPGFTAVLLNQDYSPAPAILPPGWTGWLSLGASGVPTGTTCCIDLTLMCGAESAVIEVCAVTCLWGTLGVGPDVADLSFGIRALTPNPTAGEATASFALSKAERAKLEIFDTAGHRVRIVAEGSFGAGPHTAIWDGRDSRGNLARPGTYFVRLSAGQQSATHKLVLRP